MGMEGSDLVIVWLDELFAWGIYQKFLEYVGALSLSEGGMTKSDHVTDMQFVKNCIF